MILFHTNAFNLIPGVNFNSGFVNFISTGYIGTPIYGIYKPLGI
jgi:hypothetical protein